MATEIQVNVLSEIARAAYLLNGLNDDHNKLCQRQAQDRQLRHRMRWSFLASTAGSLFHQLTYLLVEHGQTSRLTMSVSTSWSISFIRSSLTDASCGSQSTTPFQPDR